MLIGARAVSLLYKQEGRLLGDHDSPKEYGGKQRVGLTSPHWLRFFLKKKKFLSWDVVPLKKRVLTISLSSFSPTYRSRDTLFLEKVEFFVFSDLFKRFSGAEYMLVPFEEQEISSNQHRTNTDSASAFDLSIIKRATVLRD